MFVTLKVINTAPMYKLNLPVAQFKYQNRDNKVEIFDAIRKRFVALTPEEWVRQNFVHYLIYHKGYPPSLMHLESPLTYDNLDKRSDIMVYSREGKPKVIVECKSPHIPIAQETFDQIARYNFNSKVRFLIVTNGINHYCCQMNYQENTYIFVDNIPVYKEL